MSLRVIFALPKVRALIPEGRGDGPAQMNTDLVITLDSGPEGAQTNAKI